MGPTVPATENSTLLFDNRLADFLSNSLVFRQTAPYLPVPSLYALAATCKALHHIVYTSPECFRYLDLSPLDKHFAQGDQTQFDDVLAGELAVSERNAVANREDYVTFEQAAATPFHRIWKKLEQRQLLQNVRTMVLDGLPVTPVLVQDIITQERFNVHMLSIRECDMNERKLMQVLRHAVRPGRPAGTPRIKGIYYFGPRDSECANLKKGEKEQRQSQSQGTMNASTCTALKVSESPSSTQTSITCTDAWYQCSGRMIARPPSSEWADTLSACAGIIAFDAVVCRGPRHDPTTPNGYLPPAIATVALGPAGCDTCHSSPEGPSYFGQSPVSELPLLSPVPLHCSTVRAAQMPNVNAVDGKGERSLPLYARCLDCLKGRWCERCQKWWDESCYTASAIAQRTELTTMEFIEFVAENGETHVIPKETRKVIGVRRDCFGCGHTCISCKEITIRRCDKCTGEYCLEDNDASSATRCDWCNTISRRTVDLY